MFLQRRLGSEFKKPRFDLKSEKWGYWSKSLDSLFQDFDALSFLWSKLFLIRNFSPSFCLSLSPPVTFSSSLTNILFFFRENTIKPSSRSWKFQRHFFEKHSNRSSEPAWGLEADFSLIFIYGCLAIWGSWWACTAYSCSAVGPPLLTGHASGWGTSVNISSAISYVQLWTVMFLSHGLRVVRWPFPHHTPPFFCLDGGREREREM